MTFFFRIFACLPVFTLCLQANAQDVPRFPSRSAEVMLSDASGKPMRAVINNVIPQQQQAHVYIPESRQSLVLPLSAFAEDSQGTLQDWYFRDLAYDRISIESEEKLIGRTDAISSPESLPKAPVNAINAKRTDNTRNKDVVAQIRNNAVYDLSDLSVVFGLRIARDVRSTSPNQTRNSRMTAFVYTEVTGLSIPAGTMISVRSNPVPLTNCNLRYDIESPVRGLVVSNRFRVTATDRIIGWYVLVMHKGEIVAAEMTHRYLANDIIKNLEKGSLIPAAQPEGPSFVEETAAGAPDFPLKVEDNLILVN